MSLNTVKKRIDQDLAQQMQELQQRSARAIAETDAQTRATIMQHEEEFSAQTQEILERMQMREKLNTQLIVKKIVLTARRDALQETFDAVRHALLEDEAKYLQLLLQELTIASSVMQIKKVTCNAHDQPLVQALLDQIKVRASIHHQAMARGFIAEDGAVRFDATLPTIIEQLTHAHTPQVSSIIWPSDDGQAGAADAGEEEER